MRKTLISLALAAILASTNAMADADMLRIVQAALPAGEVLTPGTALELEKATDERTLVATLSSIIAWYSDDAETMTAILQAVISQGPDRLSKTSNPFAIDIAFYTAYLAPDMAHVILSAVSPLLLIEDDKTSVEIALGLATEVANAENRYVYKKPDNDIVYVASPN